MRGQIVGQLRKVPQIGYFGVYGLPDLQFLVSARLWGVLKLATYRFFSR